MDDKVCVPIAGEVRKSDGAPVLWLIEALDEPGEESSLMELALRECQYPTECIFPKEAPDTTLEDLVSRKIFGRTEPPRGIDLSGYGGTPSPGQRLPRRRTIAAGYA